MNIVDTIDGARQAFEIAGRGCVVRIGEDEPHYATVSQIAARLEPHRDATMLLTAVSEAVERYDPSTEAVILLETAIGFQVLILTHVICSAAGLVPRLPSVSSGSFHESGLGGDLA